MTLNIIAFTAKKDRQKTKLDIYLDKKIKEINKEIKRLSENRINCDFYKGSISFARDIKQFIDSEGVK